jgi:CubicO group peptidase (beta-lactamase class C family)
MTDPLAAVTSLLDRRLKVYVDEHLVPGAVYGVVCDGDLLHWSGYGLADPLRDRKPDHQTLYRVASITKTFTATAIMQLRDRGVLQLSDPIVRFLPEMSAACNPFGRIEDVTLRHLLTHESGLVGEAPTMDLATGRVPSIDEVLEAADHVAVVIPPDSAHKYSNLAFALLGEIIERVAQRPYADWIRQEVTEPLGMNDTVCHPTDDHTERLARGYNARRAGDHLQPAMGRPKPTFSDGGLWSTVEDLARWISFQMGDGDNTVLSRATRDEMQRTRLLSDQKWKKAQGLTWYGVRHNDHIFVGHGGLTYGFSSRIAFARDEGVGVIVLVNGIAPESLALDIAGDVVAARGVRPRAAAQTAAPDGVKPLLGTYVRAALGDEVRVRWSQGSLVLVTGGQDELEEHPLTTTDDPNVFIALGGREAGERLRFTRPSRGPATSFVLSGYPFRRLS